MQILHVSDIQTALQTFQAKFYFRVTWVQKKSTAFADGGIKHIESIDDWPAGVYRPDLGFDNAEEVLELKHQTLGVSTWREFAESANISQSQDAADEFVVMEWKARGFGKFTNRFDLTNYPCDTQLLKLTISSLDQGINLHDDHRDNVQSTIRKDYFLDQGFSLLDGEFARSTKTTKARGLPLASQEDSFVINPVPDKTKWRHFNTLSYIIPVKRVVRHVKQEILYPISLITLASMTSFIFSPIDPANRLAQSITVALVITGYAYVVASYFPRIQKKTVFGNYFFRSFLFVFFVVIQNTLIGVIACNGYSCDGDSDSAGQFGSTAVPSVAPIVSESTKTFGERLLLSSNNGRDSGLLDGSRSTLYDFITMGMFGVVWVLMNGHLYYEILLDMPRRETKRIEEALKLAKDGNEDTKSKELEYVRKFDKVKPLYKKKKF